MKQTICRQLLFILLHVATALVLAVLIFMTPVRIMLLPSVLIVSIFPLAASKLDFTQLHLTVFKLE